MHKLKLDLRNEMVMALENNGLAVKYHHHEVGAIGQQEIEIEMGEAALLADYSMLIKYFVKSPGRTGKGQRIPAAGRRF